MFAITWFTLNGFVNIKRFHREYDKMNVVIHTLLDLIEVHHTIDIMANYGSDIV